ncbi:MAG: bifunctional (p)ppGpp synthetase/guanosine-3',5'-bis(diphosphate) 3'-pyrophosphohydrolase [Steroidobacteraceae bacterium]
MPPQAHEAREAGLASAMILASLEADDDLIIGTALHGLLAQRWIEREACEKQFGATAVRLARELNQLGSFGLPADWTPEKGLDPAQAESLRKMLVAVVGDVRLVVARLAEQLQLMRSARSAPAATQRRLATETREVYAPLANRLGVWQIKWELEDFAFRYLEPAEYKRIAAALKSRRSEREDYLQRFSAELSRHLEQAGIRAQISARPKHIYSIWRKMQRKQVPFEQVMDVRAARVLVDSIADCYAALGVVHSLWPFIQGEFDDYIATPKDNLYRSIHTAVIGPGGEPVEVQIRTHQMHAASERGVASHWRYKEGGRPDLAYERKINQLRALLTPPEPGETERDFLDRVRVDLFSDRLYVLSPRGEIVDVPVNGTPLDFAYQVHTDLGHRTRGAKVNGRMVPLSHRLKNSDTVEIITARQPQPSRDWLSPQSGFLASPRNRAKVRAWFRKQDEAQNTIEGRALLERELQRLGVAAPPMPEILAELRLHSSDALHEALGAGDITASQVLGAIQRLQHAREDHRLVQKPRAAREAERGTPVQGIGDLLATYPKCCHPVPPEAIAGYLAVGRGVSVHAQTCNNFIRLAARNPARVLALDWGGAADGEFPVDIEVRAYDRRGLVRDVSAAIADEKISIRGMNTVTNKADNLAQMQISIAVGGLPQLSRVLARIGALPNVISARRRR